MIKEKPEGGSVQKKATSPRLIALEDVAAIWRCSRRYARDVLTKQEGFPRPAPGSVKKLRWLEREVHAFARRQIKAFYAEREARREH